MDKEYFYIIIEDRSWKHELGYDDFHIERVFDKKDILQILDSEITDGGFLSNNSLIVTNDSKLLTAYLITINEEELKMLCKQSEFNEKEIRINKDYFYSLQTDVFKYFKKILNNEIVSASMDYSIRTLDPDEHPEGAIFSQSTFIGWVENKEFKYFTTPHRYLNEEQTNKKFKLDNVKKANLETLNKLLNINILEIGKDDKNPSVNWEFRKDLLRYYDEKSCQRLYISQKHLDSLSKNNSLVFTIHTQLDQNHYIEYYVTGIVNLDEEEAETEIEIDHQKDFDDTHQPKYDRYNGAYGLDDDTIDSAFEGDSENYWNID